MNIAIETYGCETNQYTTELIAAILTKAGHKLVQKDKADLVLLNTCALETKTEKKILARIRDLNQSGQKILVAGCLTELDKDKIAEASPNASMMGNNSITQVVDIVDKIKNNFKVTRFKDKPELLINQPRMRIYPAIATVLIAEGCLDNCSFCVDRTTRGSLISYEPDYIIREIENAVAEGCIEIQLTGQDVASYGHDKSVKLPSLLRRISSIQGNFKIRMGQMNPANVLPMLEDLIVMYNHPKIYRYLDLPLQSGSNKILKDMKRRYTKEEYMMIIAAFRKQYPNITISTDVMIGYPGETDADFGETVKALKEIKPDILNIYTYSQRPYTKAGASQVPPWKVKNWAVELDQLYDQFKDVTRKRWLNWEGEVAVTQKIEGMFLSRNSAYIPILLKKATLGEKRTAEITEAQPNYFIGR